MNDILRTVQSKMNYTYRPDKRGWNSSSCRTHIYRAEQQIKKAYIIIKIQLSPQSGGQ